jgi:tripartite-type tricarboxylate transporter receptor subunit TctC
MEERGAIMSSNFLRGAGVAAIMLAAFSLPFASASADDAADFYQGRTVTIYAGSSPGGGYDLYTRALAHFIGSHIPGKPTVIASNMPGGTGLKLANWLYNAAPKDGTQLGMIGRGLPAFAMLGGKGAKFDATKFNWIGSMNNEVSVCATSDKSKVTTYADLLKTQAIFGSQGASSDSDIFAVFIRNMFGARVKLIPGYPGTEDALLAMQRGEVDGICGWSWTSVKSQTGDLLRQGKLNILLQMALNKHPDLPNVPLITELTKDPDKLAQIRLVFSRQTMGRPVTAPQDVPPARVAALRAAFDATLKDPAFVAFSRKSKMEVNPVSGGEIQSLVASVLATPKKIVAETVENLKNKAR